MSKDIWHTSNEKPDQSRYYIEEYDRFSDEIGYLINKRYGVVNTIDDLTTKRWCYLDDLMALETENKDLSDKIGKLETELDRTRKALEIAVDALKSAKTRFELINNSKFANLNNVLQIQSQCEVLKIEESLEQITALEQKDVK